MPNELKFRPLKAYFCYFVNDDEWGSFVLANSRGQAKAIFHRYYKDNGEWNDIRLFKVKDLPKDMPLLPQILDMPDDPLLEILGLEYMETEV